MDFDTEDHSLQCPKCGHGMHEVTYQDVTIDSCSHCKGLWFDVDEAHQLKHIEGSETLDSGDPAQGAIWDSHSEIDCPRCGKRMGKSYDPKQIHIWYETCNEHGLFMDAGEFTDFKFETLLDWFRGLIKGNRDNVAP